MMYCGDQRLVERAKTCSTDLITFCGTEWTNYLEQDDQSVRSHGTNQAASDWEAWCHAESHRRTGYSIWVCLNIHFFMFICTKYYYPSFWTVCGPSNSRCALYYLWKMPRPLCPVKRFYGRQTPLLIGNSSTAAQHVSFRFEVYIRGFTLKISQRIRLCMKSSRYYMSRNDFSHQWVNLVESFVFMPCFDGPGK
jgi:hypothetical protein